MPIQSVGTPRLGRNADAGERGRAAGDPAVCFRAATSGLDSEVSVDCSRHRDTAHLDRVVRKQTVQLRVRLAQQDPAFPRIAVDLGTQCLGDRW
jgi:lipid-binding SYLF domain-containing protein